MATQPKASFNKLKNLWYKKLKDEGFEDIETDEDTLKSWSVYGRIGSPEYTRYRQQSADAYYSLADLFLNEHNWPNELERIIWEYHANGISTRNITKLLEDAGIKKTNRTTVWQVISRCRTLMKQQYLDNPAPKEDQDDE